jgi:hypothetical protein
MLWYPFGNLPRTSMDKLIFAYDFITIVDLSVIRLSPLEQLNVTAHPPRHFCPSRNLIAIIGLLT